MFDSSIEPSALQITWKNGCLISHNFKHEAQSILTINQSINPTHNMSEYLHMHGYNFKKYNGYQEI